MTSGLSLIFGFLAASAALLLQVFVSIFVATPLATTTSLPILAGAAAIEESAKLIFLIRLGRWSENSITFAQATLFGTGFAATEIALSLLSSPHVSDIAAIVGIHLFGALAIYSGLQCQKRFSMGPAAGLLIAISVHVLYNSSL